MPPHRGGAAGDVARQHDGKVLCLGLLVQHIVPVGDDRHFLEAAVLVYDRGVVEGDAVAPETLHQGTVQVILVLIGEVALLQRIPDDQMRNLFGKDAVVTGRQVFEPRVGIQRFAPDRHDVRAVLRRWGKPQIQPAELFAEGPELMPLLGDDEDHPLALLPQAPAQAVERERLARAGAAADPHVAVRVLVVIVGVEERRRTVVHVEPEEHAAAVGKLV